MLLATTLAAQISLVRQEREPQARRFSSAAYDVARGCTVLFGGEASTLTNDTHEWNGQRWNVCSPAGSPRPSAYHALVYDVARGRTIAFGGDLGSLWEWDGAAWHLRIVGAGPSPTQLPAMAYDIARRRTVLYDRSSTQTWEYDGAAWTRRFPATVPLVPLTARMAYDVAGQRSLLVGENAGRFETWAWNGSDWTLLGQATGASRPTATSLYEIAYDVFRQRLVLFGGDGGHLYGNETWEWDGTAWTQRTPVVRPPTRIGHAMTYDVARRRTVLFGGFVQSVMADTWEWDGSNWAPVTPPSRILPALVYDAARGKSVLFGGMASDWSGDFDLGDTWEWDGFRWRMLTPASSPAARHQHAMAFDEQRQRVVLFGGNSSRSLVNNETWEWDGTNWSRALPAVSPPRPLSQCAMTYDRARRRILLVMATQTWEWDGVNWARLMTAAHPTGLDFSMAYDAQRQRAVLLVSPWGGGPGQTWEWDGGNWTLTAAPAPPPRGSRWAMTYDPSRRRVVASGDDMWEWDGSRWSLLAAGFGVDAMVVDERRGRLLTMAWRGTAVTGSPATSARFGLGCSCSNSIPVLGQYLPLIGNESFAIDVVNSPASSPCALGLSATSAVITVPGGCTLYLQQPLFLAALSSPAGVARLRVPIPEVLALRGAGLYAQGFVADACSALGLAFTAPRVMTIGD